MTNPAASLRAAIERGGASEVRRLLDEGANPWDMTEGVDRAPSFMALRSNNPEIRAEFDRVSREKQAAEETKARARVSALLKSAEHAFLVCESSGAESFHVAVGQYSPSSSTGERYLFFALRGDRLETLESIWLSKADYLSWSERASARWTIWAGECDAMFASAHRYTWASRDGELRLWRGRRLLAQARRQELRVRRAFRPERSIASSEIAAIRAFLGESWVARGIQLRLGSGEVSTLARVFEAAAMLDPLYDGIDLLCDASWTLALGRALAAILQRPFEKDDTL